MRGSVGSRVDGQSTALRRYSSLILVFAPADNRCGGVWATELIFSLQHCGHILNSSSRSPQLIADTGECGWAGELSVNPCHAGRILPASCGPHQTLTDAGECGRPGQSQQAAPSAHSLHDFSVSCQWSLARYYCHPLANGDARLSGLKLASRSPLTPGT